MKFISEGDIYRLAAKSELPGAEEFESWIFDEVLPSIRKHDGYIAGQESMSDEELLARALMVAQSRIEERDRDSGYFETCEVLKNGHPFVVTLITGKGQTKLYEKIADMLCVC